MHPIYNDIQMNPDSFLITCKTAFINHIYPFQFDKLDNLIYKKLDEIATWYRDTNRLQEFYNYLQEVQYLVNVWTAYFLLEKFDFKVTDKLVGLNNNQTIYNACIQTIERNLPSFKTDTEKINCKTWLNIKKGV